MDLYDEFETANKRPSPNVVRGQLRKFLQTTGWTQSVSVYLTSRHNFIQIHSFLMVPFRLC